MTECKVGERDREAGSGKVNKPGLELGTPVAHQRYMSACCTQGNNFPKNF